MKDYKYEHLVRYDETDRFNNIHLPAIMALYQEAALTHADRLGIGSKYCSETGRLWVLSRFSVKIQCEVKHRDTLRIITWPKVISGPYAIRDFTMEMGDEIVIRGTAHWLLLDAKTRKPVRLKNIADKMPLSPDRHGLEESAQRIKPREDGKVAYKHQARYCDIDQFMHVNNTQYTRWCLNCLSADDMIGKHIEDFTINYLKECTEGTKIAIRYLNEPNGKIAFQGELEDGTISFTARLLLV